MSLNGNCTRGQKRAVKIDFEDLLSYNSKKWLP
jgi:hypothetical protein